MSPTASPTTPPAPLSTLWSDPQRQALLATWLAGLQSAHGLVLNSVRLASADASFRRYLRVERVPPSGGGSLVIMDAPPDKKTANPLCT